MQQHRFPSLVRTKKQYRTFPKQTKYKANHNKILN